jgi:hypothetical protein
MIYKIETLLEELEANILYYNKLQASVSTSSIGWHIEHCLLTLDRIIDRLSQTDPANYKRKFSVLKTLIFATGIIPRGKVRSPKIVKPDETISREDLATHIQRTKEKIRELPHMKPVQFFEHPYFGHLRLKQTIRFLEIHTTHHLKIIKDIKS